jgi:hypothetical protein
MKLFCLVLLAFTFITVESHYEGRYRHGWGGGGWGRGGWGGYRRLPIYGGYPYYGGYNGYNGYGGWNNYRYRREAKRQGNYIFSRITSLITFQICLKAL